MCRVKSVTACPAYTLEIEFEDGLKGTVSLRDRLFGPMFEPLRDELYFATASVDQYGVICWPNGADLAPDALYQRLKTPDLAPA